MYLLSLYRVFYNTFSSFYNNVQWLLRTDRKNFSGVTLFSGEIHFSGEILFSVETQFSVETLFSGEETTAAAITASLTSCILANIRQIEKRKNTCLIIFRDLQNHVNRIFEEKCPLIELTSTLKMYALNIYFFLKTVAKLLNETDLKIFVYNGQLDLIINTPGKCVK